MFIGEGRRGLEIWWGQYLLHTHFIHKYAEVVYKCTNCTLYGVCVLLGFLQTAFQVGQHL